MSYFDQVEEATGFLKARLGTVRPRTGIVLGSGLGAAAEAVSGAVVIPYEEIPHFPQATVEGHSGRFMAGLLGAAHRTQKATAGPAPSPPCASDGQNRLPAHAIQLQCAMNHHTAGVSALRHYHRAYPGRNRCINRCLERIKLAGVIHLAIVVWMSVLAAALWARLAASRRGAGAMPAHCPGHAKQHRQKHYLP